MFIKVYFDDKPLFLCDAIDKTIDPFIHHDDAVFIDELDTHTIKTMIHEMQQTKVHAGVFLHSNFEELKKAFFKKFTLVQAAGGLVYNEKKEILLIFRRGKWDLPKGKLDKGEKLEDCAVREVEEETGLTELTIHPKRGVIKYYYIAKGNELRKRRKSGVGQYIFKYVYFYPAESKTKNVILSNEHVGFVWLTYKKARRRVTFENARAMLDMAEGKS